MASDILLLSPYKKETLTDKLVKLREKDTLLGKVTKAATSLKTTAVLGTILGGLVTGGAAGVAAKTASRTALKAIGKTAGKAALSVAKSPKKLLLGAVTIPTAVGVLKSSKKARETASNLINPVKNIQRGETIGELIEGKKSAADVLGIKEDSTFKEKLTTGLKAAGVVGGATALGVAGIAAVKKFKDSRQEKAAEASQLKSFALGAAAPRPVGLGGIPISAVPSQTSPDITGSQPSQSTNAVRPIQNIIQIAVR